MSISDVASEATVMPALLSLTVGLAALFAFVWLVALSIAAPLWSRNLWRSMVVAAGLWTGCEVIGGHAFLGRWIDEWRSQPSKQQERPAIRPHAIADTDDLPESFAMATERGELPDPLSWSPGVVEFEAEVQPLAAPRGRESFSQFDVGEPRAADAKKIPDPFAVGAVMLAWLAGWIILTVRFIVRRILVVYFTWRHTRPADGETIEQIGAVVRQLDVATASGQPHPEGTRVDLLRRFRIRQTDRLAAPVVYGVLRPTLLVPANFLRFLPRAQREAVVAHELVHLAGRDPLWQTVFDSFAALAWWHPAAWLARHAHKTACEAAADDGAAALPGGSRALAAALVRLGRELAAPPRFGWAALDGPAKRRSRLGRRVLRLLSGEPARRPTRLSRRGFVYSGIAVVTLVTSLLFGTALARSGVSGSSAWKTHNGGHSMTIWQTSWRSSLAAAAIAAVVGTSAAADEEPAESSDAEVIEEADVTGEAHADAIERIEAEIEQVAGRDAELSSGGEAADGSAAEQEAGHDDRERELQTRHQTAAEVEAQAARQMAAAERAREEVVLGRLRQQEAVRNAALAAAEAQLQQARSQLAFTERMVEKGHIPEDQLEAARSALEKAARELESKKQVLELTAQEIAARAREVERLTIRELRASQPPASVTREMTQVERRAHHLMRAADYLMLAGKNDLAKELFHEAKAIATGESLQPEVRLVPQDEIRRLQVVRPKPQADIKFQRDAVEDEGSREADQLRREMNELKSQVDEMRAMLQETLQQLKRERETNDDHANADDRLEDRATGAVKGIVRRVTVGEPGTVYVELSVGADDGVRRGDDVLVYRNDQLVARAGIIEAQADVSVAELAYGATTDHAEEGDRVVVRVRRK